LRLPSVSDSLCKAAFVDFDPTGRTVNTRRENITASGGRSAAGRLLAEEKMMAIDDQSLPELVKEVRRQLSLSQEDLARELGISFATVNRWENGVVKPSKLAKAQLDNFCAKMTRQGKLKLTGGNE
jgi:DNA-binding transcriptional regulator YiaG